jgi:hypothetical protein
MRWKKTISQYRRAKILRHRVKWLKFGSGENPILRWHGGSIAELEAFWRYRRRRFMPFVAGAYTAPRARYRLVLKLLAEKP